MASSSQHIQYTEEYFQKASQVVRALDRNIRSRKLYAENNPTLLRHHQELLDLLTPFLEDHHELELLVQPFELRIDETSVYQNNHQQESFAFRLFSDGIRSLSFREGLSSEETAEFLSAMATRQSDKFQDADAVTLFWEKEFDHIRYTVADSLLDEPTIEQKSTTEKIEEVLDPQMSSYRGPSTEPDEDIYEDFKVTLTPVSVGALFQERTVVSQEEFNKIRSDLLECEKPSRLILDFLDMMLAVLQEEQDPQEFEKTVEILGTILENNLLTGQIQIARIMMEQVHQFSSRKIALAEKDPQLLRKAIKILWPASRVNLLILSVNQEKIGNAEDLETLVSLMDPQAIPDLLKQLNNIVDLNRRRVVCKGIARLHKGDLGIFMPMLSSKDHEVIQTALSILSSLKNEKVLDLISTLIQHQNLTIRKESIAILKNYKVPRAFRILTNLLEDSSEEIRLLSLRLLSTSQDRALAKSLAEEIQQKPFQGKSLQERKAYFYAVAKIVGDDFIPYLSGILSSKNWFGRQELNDLYQCATFALSVVGSPLAKQTLENGVRSRNKSVRRYSEAALRHMSGTPGAPSQEGH